MVVGHVAIHYPNVLFKNVEGFNEWQYLLVSDSTSQHMMEILTMVVVLVPPSMIHTCFILFASAQGGHCCTNFKKISMALQLFVEEVCSV